MTGQQSPTLQELETFYIWIRVFENHTPDNQKFYIMSLCAAGCMSGFTAKHLLELFNLEHV